MNIWQIGFVVRTGVSAIVVAFLLNYSAHHQWGMSQSAIRSGALLGAVLLSTLWPLNCLAKVWENRSSSAAQCQEQLGTHFIREVAGHEPKTYPSWTTWTTLDDAIQLSSFQRRRRRGNEGPAANRKSTMGLKRSEMNGPIPQAWTPDDVDRLRALAASGRSAATISERLKRSVSVIRYKAHRLNITLPRVASGLKAKLK